MLNIKFIDDADCALSDSNLVTEEAASGTDKAQDLDSTKVTNIIVVT